MNYEWNGKTTTINESFSGSSKSLELIGKCESGLEKVSPAWWLKVWLKINVPEHGSCG